MADLTLEKVLADAGFFEVPEEDKGFFAFGEKRIRFERIIYGSYLLKRELFMVRGRTNNIGEAWLDRNAPEFVDYSREVDDRAIDVRMAFLMQEVSYLRATLKLQSKIELKRLRDQK